MNRKDFRPNNNSSSGISDKDRATIRKSKKYKDYSADQQGNYTVYATNGSMTMKHLTKRDATRIINNKNNQSGYGNMKIRKETSHKKHKHMIDKDKYLRGSSDKELQKSEIAQLRKDNYEQAKKNMKNPPKKAWWLPQSEYDRERAMDREVVRAKGKKAYIETTDKATR